MKDKWDKSQTLLNNANQQKKTKQETIDQLRKDLKKGAADTLAPFKEEISDLKREVAGLKKAASTHTKALRQANSTADQHLSDSTELQAELEEVQEELRRAKSAALKIRVPKVSPQTVEDLRSRDERISELEAELADVREDLIAAERAQAAAERAASLQRRSLGAQSPGPPMYRRSSHPGHTLAEAQPGYHDRHPQPAPYRPPHDDRHEYRRAPPDAYY